MVLGIQPSWMVRWSEPQAALLLTGESQLEAVANPETSNS